MTIHKSQQINAKVPAYHIKSVFDWPTKFNLAIWKLSLVNAFVCRSRIFVASHTVLNVQHFCSRSTIGPVFNSPLSLDMSTTGGLQKLDPPVEPSTKASNTIFQPRCNRTPLSQLNKGESAWHDSRSYARSAIQALELKKQQQQENMQRSRNLTAAGTKNIPHADERWTKAYIKAFPSLKYTLMELKIALADDWKKRSNFLVL
jgi:hypothetical protein